MSKGDGQEYGFIRALTADPARIPDCEIVVGYPGPAASDDRFRVYLTPTLDDYIELSADDVLYSEKLASETLSPSAVWVKREAPRTHTTAMDVSAQFLSGQISNTMMSQAIGSGFGRLEWISWTWTIATGLVCITAKVSCICPTGGNCPTASGQSATSCCLCPAR